jgi:putative phosphoesterase
VKIGLISDTHGLLRPEALQALAGVEHIIHAGDIGGPEIIETLRQIAPVDAVRGNNDKGEWAEKLPVSLSLEFEGVNIHVLHDVKDMEVAGTRAAHGRSRKEPRRLGGARARLAQKPTAAAGFQVVIAGHSHKPQITERDGILFVNPGSSGPRRFTLPVTMGYLMVVSGTAKATIKPLL